MKRVPCPCTNCKPPQRHQYCHCKGQCAKGDAYEKYIEYRNWLYEQRHSKALHPASDARVRKYKPKTD